MARRRLRELSLRIDELDSGGLGVGRYEGRIVRVRNALPGEWVDMRVLKRYRGEWLGEASVVGRASTDRVVPPCDAFPRCGGCSLQHLGYGQQLALKSERVVRELETVGVGAKRVRSPIAGPRLHYRRKARLGVRCLGDEVLLGFRESYSSRVARLSDCKTLAEPASRLLLDLRSTLQQLDAKRRVPQVEVAVGEQSVAFVIRHLDSLSDTDQRLLARFAMTHAVQVHLQPGGYDEILPLAPEKPSDLDYLLTDFGLRISFGVSDFVQANAPLNAVLVSDVVQALGICPGDRVVDLFCGIGNFSLAMARRGALVTGLETSAGSVARAGYNAGLNGLRERCEFRAVDLYDPAYRVAGDAQLMLLDPPRTGAGPNLAKWLEATALRRVVYVSCNPATFATDARVFVDQGYGLDRVGIYDMFPQTAHIETLGIFTRAAHG